MGKQWRAPCLKCRALPPKAPRASAGPGAAAPREELTWGLPWSVAVVPAGYMEIPGGAESSQAHPHSGDGPGEGRVRGGPGGQRSSSRRG